MEHAQPLPGNLRGGHPDLGVAPASDFLPGRLVDQHIVAFHARNDSVVSVTATRNVVNSILTVARAPLPAYPSPRDTTTTLVFESDKIDLAYIEPPTGGHGIWPGVYGNPGLYEWMFSQSLVPEPDAAAMAIAGLPAAVAIRRHRAAG